MATIKLSAAKSAGAAISYAAGKDKLDEETRDWLRAHGVDETVVARLSDRAVAVGGENVDIEHVRGQMRATRELFHKNTGVQAHRIIQSFAVNDLNAADPADWERANALGVELGRLIAPGHEVAVYTHIDGEGHKLHNHIIINAPNLETGAKYHQHNDFARVTKLNDRLAQEHGLSVIEELSQHERRTIAERHIDAGYVWKDDLRSRIDAAMSDPRTSNFEALTAVLSEKGVDIRVRGQNVSYAFLGPNKACHVSRGTKLGASYEKGAIQDELARRTKQLEQAIDRDGKVKRGAEQLQQSATRGIEATQGRIDGEQANRGGLERVQADAASTIRQSIKRFADRVRGTFERTERALGSITNRVRQVGCTISGVLAKHEAEKPSQDVFRNHALGQLKETKKSLAFWTGYADRERALIAGRDKYDTIQHNRKGWFRTKPVPAEHVTFVKHYEKLATLQAQALASTGLEELDLRYVDERIKDLTQRIAYEERSVPKPRSLDDVIAEAKREADQRNVQRDSERSFNRPKRSRNRDQGLSR